MLETNTHTRHQTQKKFSFDKKFKAAIMSQVLLEWFYLAVILTCLVCKYIYLYISQILENDFFTIVEAGLWLQLRQCISQDSKIA